MSNVFTSRNPAGVVVGQSAMIFTALAMGAANAHREGVAAMRAAREAASSHQIRAQLDAAINYSESLMQLAEQQASEIEHLRAENSRLRTAARTYLDAARRRTA